MAPKSVVARLPSPTVPGSSESVCTMPGEMAWSTIRSTGLRSLSALPSRVQTRCCQSGVPRTGRLFHLSFDGCCLLRRSPAAIPLNTRNPTRVARIHRCFDLTAYKSACMSVSRERQTGPVTYCPKRLYLRRGKLGSVPCDRSCLARCLCVPATAFVSVDGRRSRGSLFAACASNNCELGKGAGDLSCQSQQRSHCAARWSRAAGLA